MAGKHSGRGGRWIKHTFFEAYKLDEDGTGNYFETSQSKTDTPTLTLVVEPSHIKTGKVNRIHYRLKPTAAVTFILRIWEEADAGDYESNLHLIYESPALQASDEDYDRSELDIPFKLDAVGQMFYSIEWTGAPGNTVGFILVTGEAID